ncbi:MAG: iron ABC transporter permease [Anaerolineaceae bacterium]
MNRNARKSTWRTLALWLLPLAFLLVFFYQPLIAIFKLVFSPQFSQSWQNFSLEQVTRPLGFTLWQAVLSTLLTLALGLPSAYLFSHFDFRGRKFLRLLTLLPFILPTVVVAACFNTLLGPRGWLNLGLMALFNLSEPPIQLLNSLPAILLAHVFYNTSIVIRIVGSAWSRLDQRLVQAATMLGARPAQAFKEVTLPLLSPAIIGATLLVFLFDFTSFGVVLMLGGPQYATLEVEIYTQAMYMLNLPLAGLLSVVQLGFTLLIALLQNRLSVPRYGRAALSAEKTNLRKPKTRAEKTWTTVIVILLVILIATPLLSLTLRSFVTLEAARGERGEVQTGFTLQYYRELFVNRTGSLFYVPPITAIRNSLIYSGLTVLIATGLGLLAAYALTRPGRLNRWIEPLFMLPLGASAVTLGLGFLVVFNVPPWTNLDFPLLIPIAHSLVALPLVVRTLLPALRGIPNSLRQAAGVLGAGPLQAFKEVDLPILLRALIVSMVFAFTISLGEFGASSFLSTPQTPTIPVAIYRYISQPGALNYGQALAMSTLLMGVCAAGSWLIEKIRLPGEELF